MPRTLSAVLGFAVLLPFGCRPTPPSPTYDQKTIETAEQFRKLVGAYNQAYRAKRKTPTPDDLKPFLKQYGDPDALLKSPRDGKPLVIVPGFTPDTQPKGDEQPIILYELTGVDGKRLTLDVRGMIVEMSEDEFYQVKFAGGHKPTR